MTVVTYRNGTWMTNNLNDSEIIGSVSEPTCYLCGSQGVILHAGLSDQWLGAPGKWDLMCCSNPDCGLYWLDPMPSTKDIWKAYRSYFTHSDYDNGNARKIDWLNFLLLKIHKPLYKLFEHAVGMRKVEKEWRKKADMMFLDEVPHKGNILDVGCGKGDLLVRFLRKGWTVEGLEVDAEAISNARMNHGLNIHLGTLEDQRFSNNMFDAITMNHVIEHVHDPVALIRECLRVLKPGGHLVLATPNSQSLGYKKFGRFWTHLDPPRHLHLFTKKTMKECVTRAGFRSINSFCAPGYAEGAAIRYSIIRKEDASGKKRWAFPKWVEASYLKVLAYYLFFVKNDDEVGEEIFLIATKDK
jgi:2-polyprenyl-3-methyl-5-hydroxy-6-metoxy-1,4-benzoquinol methylase